MALNGDERPPQTLRQAKAAYRKSNRTPQLSEKELRIIKRRAELEERAAKLREKEKRRLENKKKREEKAKAEKLAQPKRAGSATIGGAVVHKPSERCDLLDKFVSRKRTCSEVPSEAQEEATRLSKSLKLSPEPVVSPSKVAEPTGKENSSPKQPDTTPHTPTSSRKTPLASQAVTTTKALTPRNPNIISPTPRSRSAVVTTTRTPKSSRKTPKASQAATTTKALTPRNPNIISPTPRSRSAVVTIPSHDLVCLDDWQDAVISSSQLEREMSNPTQPPAKTAPKVLVRPGGPVENELPLIPPFSTQDLELTKEDLEEIGATKGGVASMKPVGLRRTHDDVRPGVKLATEPPQGVGTVEERKDEPPSSYGSSWIDDDLLLQIPLDGDSTI